MGSAPLSQCPGKTDEELMAEFQATGDEQVYAELVKRHQTPIRRYIREKIHCRGACGCDDLTQEVLFNMFRYRSHYEVGRSFRCWLYSIASRVIWVAHKYETRKCRNRTRVPEYESENTFDAEDDSQARVFDHTDAEKVRALLLELADDERAAIELVFFKGLSWRQASAQLGVAHGTFCTTMTRAIQWLRKRFTSKVAA